MASKAEKIIMENLENIEKWRGLGMPEREVAKMLGIGYTTYRDIKRRNSALSTASVKTENKRAVATRKQTLEVEKTLFQMCVGYDITTKKKIKLRVPMKNEAGDFVTDSSGKVIMTDVIEEIEEVQHVLPDFQAVRFYLMNKAKADWKNDPERLALEKKRVENDTKRTKLAEDSASGDSGGRTIEDILREMSEEAEERERQEEAERQAKEKERAERGEVERKPVVWEWDGMRK